MRRALWTGLGWVFFAIGAVGAVVPLLPTVVFMLVAAYCFARGSERVHDWLLSHPRFGPPIRDWREHRAIGRGAKRAAMIAIAVAFALSVLLGVPPTVLAVQGVALTVVAAFILSRPERPAA